MKRQFRAMTLAVHRAELGGGPMASRQGVVSLPQGWRRRLGRFPCWRCYTPEMLQPSEMTPLDRSRLLARVFTRPVLAGLARSGCARELSENVRRLQATPASAQGTVASLMDAGLEELGRNYRCEYVYKAAIASRIVFGKHSPRTASLAIELGVDGSIVDAAVFNGTSTAYEIKTEFDSPIRLTTQTPAYLRAFECVNLVTHPDLIKKYEAVLDARVGIYALTDGNSLSRYRAAVPDVSRIEPAVVFRMLRRAEYVQAVSSIFGEQPNLPNGLVDEHYRGLFCKLTCEQAHRVLVDAMRARTTDDHTAAYMRALPQSMRALGYATPLSAPQRQRVLNALAAPA
jgi:hypothetical protein